MSFKVGMFYVKGDVLVRTQVVDLVGSLFLLGKLRN